jgi:hypothetical protein
MYAAGLQHLFGSHTHPKPFKNTKKLGSLLEMALQKLHGIKLEN